MPTFEITLGNTTHRRGHRSDCAHARIVVSVEAADRRLALDAIHRGEWELVALDIGERTALDTAPCKERK